MRILLVIPYFYPAWTYGGSVKVAYDVSRGLVKRGHEVGVYTSDGNNGCSRVDSRIKEVDGITVHYFRNVSAMTAREMKLFMTPEMIPVVKREIQSFEIVHLHEYRSFQNIIVHHYTKKYGVPYVLQAHGSLPRIVAKQRLKWIYDVFFGYRLLRDASKVVALSQIEVQQFRNMGVPEEKIEVIPNGIDFAGYDNLPPKGSFKKKFGVDEDEKIILYLGRIHKTKGIDFLIKAYARLVKNMKFNDALLIIAGADDGYLNEAKSLVTHLGISDEVLFTGMLPEHDKIPAFVDASLCAYLGPQEPFGIVSLEAAASGAPVIISEGTEMANIVEQGSFGFSVKYGDIVELAEIMKKVLNNDDLLEEMGEKGRKYVFGKFNWANIVTKFEKVYEEAVTGAK